METETLVVSDVIDAAAAASETEAPAVAGKRDERARLAMHLSALRKETQAAVGSGQVQTRLDGSRGVWQAWVGPRFENAEFRGEWKTESGALRRLRNAKVGSSVPSQPAATESPPHRPMPAGVQLLDAMDARRRSSKPKLQVRLAQLVRFGGMVILLVSAAIIVANWGIERLRAWIMTPGSLPASAPAIVPAEPRAVPRETAAEPPSAPEAAVLPTRRTRRSP